MPLPPLPRSSFLAALLAVSLAIGGLTTPKAAQKPSAGGLAPVTLDFRAVTDNGDPILDLAPGDIALKIDGRDRKVGSLQVFDYGRPAAGAPLPVVPPPFASNRLADAGRDVLLLLEDESISPGREDTARAAVEELMGGLAPRDRVGLITIPRGGTNVGFTARREAVREGLAGVRGRASRSESAGDIACRTRLTLGLLKGVFRDYSGEAPTTVILLSSSLTAPASDARIRISEPSGLCEVRTEDFNEVADAALASRTDFYVGYVVDGSALAGSADASIMAAGLESLAGVTGGQLLRLAGNQTGAMARVARQTSAHYLLSFEPELSERDGGSHRVELRVARDGVKVRARSRLTMARFEDRPRDDAPPSARDMLRVAAAHRDLPLRAAGFASRDADERKVKIVVLLESADPAAKLESAMAGLFDSKGKLVAQWTAQAAELVRSPVVAALLAPPGSYRLRVAATDAAGRGGSVDTEVRAALADAAPVKLSALALGAAVGGSFVPRLLFTGEQVVVGYLEVYDAPKGAAVTATLELAESEDGPAAVSLPARVPTAVTGATMPVFGGIQIDALPPGDYVIRAVIAVDGKPVGRVSATLRKAGK